MRIRSGTVCRVQEYTVAESNLAGRRTPVLREELEILQFEVLRRGISDTIACGGSWMMTVVGMFRSV